MATMNIQLNGEAFTAPKDATIADLISLMALENKRIAVELNEEIVPRSKHGDIALKENDVVEVVTAIGGG